MKMLRRAPGFSFLCIAILSVSIGAATAVFSAFHALLLKPLPYAQAERLVAIDGLRKGVPGYGVGWSDIDDWQRSTDRFQSIAGCSPRTYGMAQSRPGPVEVILSCQTTPDFFGVFEVRPLIGRPMQSSDAAVAPRSLWLSYRFWQSRFGGEAAITRRTLFLNEEAFVVAGVLPADFRYLDAGREPDVYFVIDSKDYRAQRGGGALHGVARLRPGVSLQQAQAQLDAAVANLRSSYPEGSRDYRAMLKPMQQAWAGSYAATLPLLLAAVGLLLWIACLNIATLVLARALSRTRETAMRLAIGASVRQVLRENLRETLTISLLGGFAGLAVAQALLYGLNHASRYFPQLPLLDPVSLDGVVFACVAVVCAITAILFALLPTLAMRHIDLVSAVRGGVQQTVSRRGVQWRRWLVTAQIAASVVLLGNTLLLARSFYRILTTSPGFDPQQVLVFGFGIPETRYDTDAKMAAFHQTLIERLGALNGVEAVSAAIGLPMSGSSGRSRFLLPGDSAGTQRFMQLSIVGPDYLRLLRIPLLAGRSFSLDDRIGKPGVVLINQTMARLHFSGRNPIGERLRMSWWSPSYPKGSEYEIVGVVADTRQGSLEQGILPQVYAATAQLPSEGIFYLLRTAAPPETLAPAVNAAIASLDPTLQRVNLRPMLAQIDSTLRDRRISLVLMGGFSTLAALLALAGVGSLLSFLSVQRSKEFGIRVALGDSPGGLARLVVRQAVMLASAGLVVGIPAAMAIAELLRARLHQTSPLEWSVYLVVVLTMSLMSVLAALIPAWRAARVDPARVLRTD